ncbi:MAG: TrpR-like protein YerC/YecD [Parcubacteria group bacterium Gr01-1014_8]|nr:MAG: TrpR-like protein YerC/YecD [Parcubacteria group bacterium Gr01-1014_8]
MDWKSLESKQLIAAILALRSTEEVRCFLRDLLTKSELKEFAGRLKTAEMLSENIPYSDIKKATGFSSTTIARVSKWLQKGKGGYKTIIPRLHHGALISRGRGAR